MPDWKKIGKRSKDKGKAFERDIAKRLTVLTGRRWRRTICSGGQYESYDVKCLDGGYPPIECKNRKDITLEKVSIASGQRGETTATSWKQTLP